MRVFISSLITGFESLRDAAASASATLGHEPVRAEDFQASPDSPQQACLAGVRGSDVVVLILGERYGVVQQSGLSATHEEYRVARESRPVLVFIQQARNPSRGSWRSFERCRAGSVATSQRGLRMPMICGAV